MIPCPQGLHGIRALADGNPGGISKTFTRCPSSPLVAAAGPVVPPTTHRDRANSSGSPPALPRAHWPKRSFCHTRRSGRSSRSRATWGQGGLERWGEGEVRELRVWVQRLGQHRTFRGVWEGTDHSRIQCRMRAPSAGPMTTTNVRMSAPRGPPWVVQRRGRGEQKTHRQEAAREGQKHAAVAGGRFETLFFLLRTPRGLRVPCGPCPCASGLC